MQKIFPELVKFDSLSGNYSVDYIGMIPILTNALNEQQEIINKQQNQISEIQKELVELRKKR